MEILNIEVSGSSRLSYTAEAMIDKVDEKKSFSLVLVLVFYFF